MTMTATSSTGSVDRRPEKRSRRSAVVFGRTLFTQEVVEQIPIWAGSDGLSNQEIADRIGCTVGSLLTTCSRLKITLNRRAMRGGYIVPLMLMVSDEVYRALEAKSYLMGLGPRRLAESIINTVVNDKLYEAVLDSTDVAKQEEAKPKRRRKRR